MRSLTNRRRSARGKPLPKPGRRAPSARRSASPEAASVNALFEDFARNLARRLVLENATRGNAKGGVR